MNSKKVSVYIGFISIALLILINLFPFEDKNENELNKYGVETLGKIINFKIINPRGSSPPKEYLDYIFVTNGKDYIYDESREEYSNVKKGSFYKLVYSSRNPKINKIYLNEEITDTTLIIKAGFKKYTKINKYDVYGNFLYTKDTLYFKR